MQFVYVDTWNVGDYVHAVLTEKEFKGYVVDIRANELYRVLVTDHIKGNLKPIEEVFQFELKKLAEDFEKKEERSLFDFEIFFKTLKLLAGASILGASALVIIPMVIDFAIHLGAYGLFFIPVAIMWFIGSSANEGEITTCKGGY